MDGDGRPTLAGLFRECRQAVVLTGAGVSTESGLSDFRSRTGLWQKIDPIKAASIKAWRSDPHQFFQFYRQRLRRLEGAEPNPAHRALALLEKRGYIDVLITQNVDGLHHRAGSEDIVEVHGNLRQAECLTCSGVFGSEVLLGGGGDVPRCKVCDSVLKPRVVLFGEALPEAPWQRAVEAVMDTDLLLVVGSSLQVSPVNALPIHAVKNGARLAIINLEPTPYDGQAALVCQEEAGSCLTRLVRELELDSPL